MSVTYFERAAAGPGAWQVFAGKMSKAVGELKRWNKRRRDRQHLKELPDYLLRDIGMSRMDIDVMTAADHRTALMRRV